MIPYLRQRLAYSALVILGAYTITFSLLFLLPSDPISIKLSQETAAGSLAALAGRPEIVAALNARYGLDQPMIVQYASGLGRLLSGDLGLSISTGIPIAQTLGDAVPQTAALAASALVLAVLIGGALAVLATYLVNPWLREFLLSLPALGLSLPVFWVGLMLLQVFSFNLYWFPASGNDGLQSLILPAITLAIPNAAILAQILARGLQDVLDRPHIDTARSKGLTRLQVHLRHVLRNGCLPALAALGVMVGNLLAGAVIVETVFARTGIGRVTYTAVNSQDYPMVLAIIFVSSTAYALANIVVDLVSLIVDPRLRRGLGRA